MLTTTALPDLPLDAEAGDEPGQLGVSCLRLIDIHYRLLEMTRNVVINPVRAGMVNILANGPRRSHRVSTGFESAAPWLLAGEA